MDQKALVIVNFSCKRGGSGTKLDADHSKKYEEEKKQWHLFYDDIETLTTNIKRNRNNGGKIKSELRDLFGECRVFW